MIRITNGGPVKFAASALRRKFVGFAPVGVAERLIRNGDFNRLVRVDLQYVNMFLDGQDLKRFRKRSRSRVVVSTASYIDLTKPVEMDVPHPTIREMWIEGRSYQETTQFRTMTNAVDAYLVGKCEDPARMGAYWCKSHEDVQKYFNGLINTFNDIQVNGYRTQAQLRARSSKGVVSYGDEMNVLIDAKGRPVFYASGANHRFSICRLLGVESVPCKVVAVDSGLVTNTLKRTGLGFQKRMEALLNCIEYRLQAQ